MKVKTTECKCGHSKYEHSSPSDWDEDEDTLCFHEFCTCPKFDPIEVEVKEEQDTR